MGKKSLDVKNRNEEGFYGKDNSKHRENFFG